MPLAQIPIRNPAVIAKEIFGEAVLVNPDTGASMVLNRTGLLVWQSIDGSRDLAQLVAALKRHYPDAPEPEATQDVALLLDMLFEDGFVGYEVLA